MMRKKRPGRADKKQEREEEVKEFEKGNRPIFSAVGPGDPFPSRDATVRNFCDKKLVINGETSTAMDSQRRRWSELETDIALRILDKLGLADRFRFSVVCVPWKHITAQFLPSNPLMVLTRNGKFRFFCFVDRKFHKLLPDTPGTACHGASRCCLLLSHVSSYFLLYTLTKSRTPLRPSLAPFSMFKAILTAAPTGTHLVQGRCVVYAICSPRESRVLRSCKPREDANTSWTRVDDFAARSCSPAAAGFPANFAGNHAYHSKMKLSGSFHCSSDCNSACISALGVYSDK